MYGKQPKKMLIMNILDILKNRFLQLGLVTSERHVLKGVNRRGNVTP